MCYERKCCMCMSVKSACLVLAVLSAIGLGMILLGSVISGVLLAAGTIYVNGNGFGDAFFFFGGMAIGVVILIIGICSLIAFIFTVLLCNGISKRRPGQVKAYFIYGVTMTVPTLLVALGYVIFSPVLLGPGILVLFDCAIYSLFLRLVHQTYFILLEEAAPKHQMPHAGMQPQMAH